MINLVTESVSALSDEGPFAEHMTGFAARSGQLSLTEAIAQAIVDDQDLMAEAGTGTGKTFAYLVPALLSGKKIFVSTGTKNLQDQLFERDLPAVAKRLKLSVRTARLKGRANYLCHYRLAQYASDPDLSRFDHSLIRRLRTWAESSADGDLDRDAILPEQSMMWPRVTSNNENCLGSECPDYEDCFVVKARRKAMMADVVVVNHHLLMADMALKKDGFGELLPAAEVIVVDEAHKLSETASQFFGQQISTRSLQNLGDDALRESLELSGASSEVQKARDDVEQALKDVRLALQPFPERGGWETVADTVTAQWKSLCVAVQTLQSQLDGQAERSTGMRAVADRATQAAQSLAMFTEAHQEGQIRWYEKTARGFRVQATPLEVASAFSDMRARLPASWVFTSATLSVAGEFSHFAHQLGLDQARSLTCESPFDFRRQALLYVPEKLPDQGHPEFSNRLLELLVPLLRASQGRAFLLFTSHRRRKEVAEGLRQLDEWTLFEQGDDGRQTLIENFRVTENAILLGAASFWEGVDVAGDALKLVVIDRLPFQPPNDPVIKARADAIAAQGGNAFMDYQLPQAVLRLKQGAGRLVRTVNDTGVLMVCDNRIRKARYGSVFIQALPPMLKTDKHEKAERFLRGPDATV